VVKQINCCISHHCLELVVGCVLQASVKKQNCIDPGSIHHEHAQSATCTSLEYGSAMLHSLHDDWNYGRSADNCEMM
jgi:hypothetical protein